jgi:hypothetical protein
MGTCSLPGVKRPGRGFDYPPPSSAEVKEKVDEYLYSTLWGFVACSRVNFIFTCTVFIVYCWAVRKVENGEGNI